MSTSFTEYRDGTPPIEEPVQLASPQQDGCFRNFVPTAPATRAAYQRPSPQFTRLRKLQRPYTDADSLRKCHSDLPLVSSSYFLLRLLYLDQIQSLQQS